MLTLSILFQHVATLASLYRFHKGDYAYPKSKIDVCWEKVLLNQCEFICATLKVIVLTSLLQSTMVSSVCYVLSTVDQAQLLHQVLPGSAM